MSEPWMPLATSARIVARLERIGFGEHLARVAKVYHVEPWEIVSRSRRSPLPWARQAVWAALRVEGLSFPRIADLFEVDHSTVMHGVRVHAKLLGAADAEGAHAHNG